MNALITSPSEVSLSVLERWGSLIGSTSAAQRLASHKDLSERVLERLFDIYDVKPNLADADPSIWRHVKHAQSSRADMQLLCGLIFYGKYIRSSVTSEKVEQLRSLFGMEKIRFAARQSDLVDESMCGELDADQIGMAVKRVGDACLNTWIASLPKNVQRQMAMLEHQQTNTEVNLPANLGMDLACSIVERSFEYFETDH